MMPFSFIYALLLVDMWKDFFIMASMIVSQSTPGLCVGAHLVVGTK